MLNGNLLWCFLICNYYELIENLIFELFSSKRQLNKFTKINKWEKTTSTPLRQEYVRICAKVEGIFLMKLNLKFYLSLFNLCIIVSFACFLNGSTWKIRLTRSLKRKKRLLITWVAHISIFYELCWGKIVSIWFINSNDLVMKKIDLEKFIIVNKSVFKFLIVKIFFFIRFINFKFIY